LSLSLNFIFAFTYFFVDIKRFYIYDYIKALINGGCLMKKSRVFIEDFKRFRKNKKYTQQDLADASGVSIYIIKQIETGRSGTTEENFKALADALEVPLFKIYREEYKETTVIPVLNSKGGCSKTTIAQNLSYELGMKGFKVLVVDADLQCNLSHAMQFDFSSSQNLYNAIINSTFRNPVNIEDYITQTKYVNLDMIGNSFKMAQIDNIFHNKEYKEQLLKKMFSTLLEKGTYDYIIFDCNPNLGITNINITEISNFVLIPVELSPFGVMGMNVLIDFIKNIQVTNSKLEILGLLKSNVDQRYTMNTIADKNLKLISEKRNLYIFETSISTDSNVGKSQLEQLPLGEYEKNNKVYSRAREDFKNFTQELIDRVKYING
jgi:chromosome partitioning protein